MQHKRIWIALAAVHTFALGLAAQGYTLQKLAMTGDNVPGNTAVTEQFAYFQDVHVFPDGQVGFSGITTRTGNIFRSAPRGIYLSNTSGTISVMAEIDDAEAWRSFGLPYNELDSDDSKNFAYNFVDPTFDNWVQGIAKVAPGQAIQPLSPADDTFMLVSNASLPANNFFQGTFSEIWGGIMLNAQGQVQALADFAFTNDPENPKRGIFVASGVNDIRNVVFAGDDAPGFSDATFFDLLNPVLADNGNVFFRSTLTGSDVSSSDNETLWMENDGAFTLLLREGSPAPGRPENHQIRLTSIIMQVIAINGDKMVVFAGASAPGGGLHRVFWIANTDGSGLSPIFHYKSSPILSDSDYFTATDQGSVAFSTIDGNTIIMDDNGNVYFEGGGEFANEDFVGGVWKYDASNGSINLIQRSSALNGGLYSIDLLAVNNTGSILFHARDSANSGTKGVWVRRPSGALTKLSKVGDMIDGRPITGFAVHSGIKTLGLPRKHTLMTDTGDCVFVALLADTPNDSDNKADEAIMLATAPVLPTERYLWNGGGGDSNWHKVLSWEDLDINTPATRIPGDEAGTEVVVIENNNIDIDERAIHLKKLTASGTMNLNQEMTLEEDSMVDDISINASITSSGKLTFEEQGNYWHQGDLQGSGSFLVWDFARFELDPTMGPLTLRTELDVGGLADHNDSVLLLAGVSSMLKTSNFGTYEMTGGSITDDTDGIHIENAGTFLKTGPGTATIDAFMESKPDSTIRVEGGTLEFTDPINLSGTMRVENGASVVFDLSPVLLGTPAGDGFKAQGATSPETGIIRFSGSEVLVSSGDTAEFNLGGSTGKVELLDDAHFYGSGTVLNKGDFELRDGLFETELTNEGDFLMESDQAMLQSDVENKKNVILRGEGVLGTPGNEQDWVFDNERLSELTKQGTGNFDIYHFTNNKGDILVREGSLTFWDTLVFGDSENPGFETMASISDGAELILGEEAGFQLFFNSEVTTILGHGRNSLFTINAEKVTIENRNRVYLLTNTHWKRGYIEPNFQGNLIEPNLILGGLGNFSNLLIEHPDPDVELKVGDLSKGGYIHLLVTNNSTATQNSDILIYGTIEVKGSYHLNDSMLRVESTGVSNNIFRVRDRAALNVSGASSIGDGELFATMLLDIETAAVISLQENSTLNVFKLLQLEEGLGGTQLNAGFWLLEDNATVNMPNVQINRIGEASLYMSPGSSFANLPDVPGSFINSGLLTLEGITFSPSDKFINEATAGVYLVQGIVEAGTAFENKGIVYGTGSIKGIVQNDGEMSPGLSPGIITIEGDFTQGTDGELFLELSEGQPGTDYDQLNITGTATLGGTLTIDCLDETFPEDDTAFAAIVASSFSGEFDQVVVNMPTSRQTFDLDMEGSQLVARATTLNIATFNEWASGVFTSSEQANANVSGLDANPDGDAFSNLLEYVFDTNPKLKSESQVQATYSYGQGRPTEVHVTFPWANDVTDANYALQRSNDMLTWVDLPSTETGSVDEGTVSRKTLTAALPNENPIYIRLVVTRL